MKIWEDRINQNEYSSIYKEDINKAGVARRQNYT
jgi:hypothetical protein